MGKDRFVNKFINIFVKKIYRHRRLRYARNLVAPVIFSLRSKKRNYLRKKLIRREGYPDLNESQYWSYKELVNFQNDRLKKLVDYAYTNIPGYRRKFDNAALKPSDIQSVCDLHKLPITTRKELQNNKDFVNHKLVNNVLHTGGSTGTSLRYYESKISRLIRWDVHVRGWEWADFRPIKKHALIASSQSIVKEGNRLHLIGDLTDENLKKNVEVLKTFKPFNLKGYVSSLFIFARYCITNNIYLSGIQSVIPTSENLYDYQRQTMEQAFDCKVFEEYCCNDGGACAWECEKREGLHYSMERAIIEDVKSRMIVTDLWNYAMPFIRYENGDTVRFLDKKCTCKRQLPLIKVKGRTNDILITPKGIITPSFLVHHGIGLVGADRSTPDFRSGIRAIQYVQKPGNILCVNIVKNSWCTNATIEKLKEDLDEFMTGLKIEINYMNDLPKTRRGKRSFIINEDKELLGRYLDQVEL